MDLIPEFRAEFDQLIHSMHHQLDVHAESLFQLFLARLKPSSHNLEHESRQPQVGANWPSIIEVVLSQKSGTNWYISIAITNSHLYLI